ncbi:MAG TPA: DUF190 domain-containing protein [Acidimicrobiales bacterium]|nr:DUF190 domain-containing protein [Acidimicrobiales bacterium]
MSGAGGRPPRVARLTITLSSRDHVHHHSLRTEILRHARRAGIAGATVLGGPPLVVHMVDERDKLRALADELTSVAPELTFTIEDVEVLGPPDWPAPPMTGGRG